LCPDGVLFGSSKAHRQLRRKLLNECELQGIISMPGGVFKPYAGVSTAIIIFVKGGETNRVWFYDMESDGYTLDDKRSKINGGGDLPDIIKKWKKRKEEAESKRNSKFFYIDKKEIEEADFDLSISRYKITDYEEIEYEDPKIIISKIENLEKEIITGLDDLKNL
jgi:type I restriction enzyme M protein